MLTGIFNSQIPTVDNAQFIVTFEAMSATDSPIIITQNEYMRRMKEMAAFQPGMNFYGEMPDSYNLIVNTEHPLIAKIRENADANVAEKLAPITKSINDNNAKITEIRDANKDKTMSEEDNANISSLEEAVKSLRADETSIMSEYASNQPIVKQLIDLALLGNGLLKGEALNSFIQRSVSLL
jgi:molecular chaperone HtpG